MPTYDSAGASAAALNAATYWSFNTNARRASIRTISCFTQAATLSPIGIGVPANNATPPTTTSTVTPQGRHILAATMPDPAAVSRLGIAWNTAPTAPSPFMMRFTLAAAAGQGFILPFDNNPIIIGQSAATQWIVGWNYSGSTGSALDVWIAHDE